MCNQRCPCSHGQQYLTGTRKFTLPRARPACLADARALPLSVTCPGHCHCTALALVLPACASCGLVNGIPGSLQLLHFLMDAASRVTIKKWLKELCFDTVTRGTWHLISVSRLLRLQASPFAGPRLSAAYACCGCGSVCLPRGIDFPCAEGCVSRRARRAFFRHILVVLVTCTRE